jgi:hypothetical protein
VLNASVITKLSRSQIKIFGLLLTLRSPLAPLQKGGTGLKVPLLKGDLGGSHLSQPTVEPHKHTPHEISEGLRVPGNESLKGGFYVDQKGRYKS